MSRCLAERKLSEMPRGMRIEDVKVGMKVVPHDKTVCMVWNEWIGLSSYSGPSFLKEHGYLVVCDVSCKQGKVWLGKSRYSLGDAFSPSDLTPYQQKNTHENIRVIRNGKATIVILPDGHKGVAKCNPADEYNAEYGFILAYQRAREAQLGA